MSFDTKYRPLKYAGILGQDATIKVCKEYVRSGHGFRQSYVFAGSHGGGKTSCARILARALLCESPVGGDPCDVCQSCVAMLADRSEGFIEIDAASNSGKDHVKRIIEDVQFGTYSGQRRIYLLDEAHEMSKQAFDVLLKPLEDNIRGTPDKQLVCIFCTTEVEKIRPAILSRCAPTFRIRPNTPEEIASRLAYICTEEGIEYEAEALPLIAEVVECHVRDAIKAVEGVSMLGAINRANVNLYLALDANDLFLEILENLGGDISTLLAATEKVLVLVAPGVCYEKMAEVCMLTYRLISVGTAQIPSFWDKTRLQAIGEKHKEFLIQFAQKFAERPGRPSPSMFACDVASLHQIRSGVVVRAPMTEITVPSMVGTQGYHVGSSPLMVIEAPSLTKPETFVGSMQRETIVTKMGVSVNPSAQHIRPPNGDQTTSLSKGELPPLMVSEFSSILRRRFYELIEEDDGGSTRRHNVGGP